MCRQKGVTTMSDAESFENLNISKQVQRLTLLYAKKYNPDIELFNRTTKKPTSNFFALRNAFKRVNQNSRTIMWHYLNSLKSPVRADLYTAYMNAFGYNQNAHMERNTESTARSYEEVDVLDWLKSVGV